MKHVSIAEAESRFFSLLAEVLAGKEIALTQHGKVVARFVPAASSTAAAAFHDLWAGDDEDIDLQAPADPRPGPVHFFDD